MKDESKIPPSLHEQYSQLILDLVLYNAEDCQALRDFEPVQMNTHCVFAKKSILWGAMDYEKSISLGMYMYIHCMYINHFINVCIYRFCV